MFAQTRAATVAAPRTTALPVSVARNARSAVRLCQIVCPVNSDPEASFSAEISAEISAEFSADADADAASLIEDHRLPPAGTKTHDRRLAGGGANGPDVLERRRDA